VAREQTLDVKAPIGSDRVLAASARPQREDCVHILGTRRTDRHTLMQAGNDRAFGRAVAPIAPPPQSGSHIERGDLLARDRTAS
jgi:hypothetical protein